MAIIEQIINIKPSGIRVLVANRLQPIIKAATLRPNKERKIQVIF